MSIRYLKYRGFAEIQSAPKDGPYVVLDSIDTEINQSRLNSTIYIINNSEELMGGCSISPHPSEQEEESKLVEAIEELVLSHKNEVKFTKPIPILVHDPAWERIVNMLIEKYS